MKKIKVAIVDDHAVVRMGMKYALSVFKDLEFVGEHPDGEGAVEFVRRIDPDVLLLDIRMPVKDGVSALREILADDPSRKVMMLTTAGTEEEVYQSLKLGAKGYVMKDSAPGEIVDAIRAIAAGGECVPDEFGAPGGGEGDGLAFRHKRTPYRSAALSSAAISEIPHACKIRSCRAASYLGGKAGSVLPRTSLTKFSSKRSYR